MGLTPGDETQGVWNLAHYPLPNSQGNQVITLLVEHHAIQGVLQSEEMGTDCIWGWEGKFLKGELLALFKKWMSFKGRRVGRTNANKPSASWESRKENWSAVSASGGRASALAKKARGETWGEFKPHVHSMGGKQTASQKWKCPHCGMTASAATIANHMKAKGHDPKTKQRVA